MTTGCKLRCPRWESLQPSRIKFLGSNVADSSCKGIMQLASPAQHKMTPENRGYQHSQFRAVPLTPVQLMICRAPSLPSTPGSCGLGLRSRPFLRLRNESMPPLPALPFPPRLSYPSAGKVELWSASSLQGAVSSRTIWTPPPLLGLRVDPFWRGRGRENDVTGGGGGGCRSGGEDGDGSGVVLLWLSASPSGEMLSAGFDRLMDPSVRGPGEPLPESRSESCLEWVEPPWVAASSGFL